MRVVFDVNVLVRIALGNLGWPRNMLGRLQFVGERPFGNGTIIAISPSFPDSRGSKDNYLLALAGDSDADFLVSNDPNLLCLSHIAKCQIVTPGEFVSRLAM